MTLRTRLDLRRAPANSWGIPEALLGFVVGVVLSLIAAGVAEGIAHYRSGAPLPVGVTTADVVGLWIGLVGAAVVAVRRHGSGPRAEAISPRGNDRRRPDDGGSEATPGRLRTELGFRFASVLDLVGGAVVGLGCQFLLVPALYWPFEQFDHGLAHSLSSPAHQDTAAAHGTFQIVLLLVVLAVGAPLVEELFFRGLVLRGLLGAMPVPFAVVVSALVFALAHFEAVQFLGLAAFGVVQALLAWGSGRLGPGIASHAAFNAVAVLSLAHLH